MDPTADILAFAEAKRTPLHAVSLGQGQGPVAAARVEKAQVRRPSHIHLSLKRGTNPKCLCVRVALGTGCSPGQRNRRASRNGRVSHLHPIVRFATFFSIALWFRL
jgi:hypothetical protein